MVKYFCDICDKKQLHKGDLFDFLDKKVCNTCINILTIVEKKVYDKTKKEFDLIVQKMHIFVRLVEKMDRETWAGLYGTHEIKILDELLEHFKEKEVSDEKEEKE